MMHKKAIVLSCSLLCVAAEICANQSSSECTKVTQRVAGEKKAHDEERDGRVATAVPVPPPGMPVHKSMAFQADPYQVYHACCQNPAEDVQFLDAIYCQLKGKKAYTLKEDFSGTGLLAYTWVCSDPKRRAWAIDYDAKALEWGKQHWKKDLAIPDRKRLNYIYASVLDKKAAYPHVPRTDIVCVTSNSYFVLRKRNDLKTYLQNAYASVADNGILVLGIFGGLTPQGVRQQDYYGLGDRQMRFTWDQSSFDALTNYFDMAIHPYFSDESYLHNASMGSYRLWSVPEMVDLLEEVGFKRVRFFDNDPDVQGDTILARHRELTSMSQTKSWALYLVAEK